MSTTESIKSTILQNELALLRERVEVKRVNRRCNRDTVQAFKAELRKIAQAKLTTP